MMKNNKLPITALYCRTACADDAEIVRQEQELRGYAAEAGYEMTVCYADNGASEMCRTGLQNLFADIDAGNVQRILTLNLSRLTRDMPKLGGLLKYFDEHNVELVSVNDGVVI